MYSIASFLKYIYTAVSVLSGKSRLVDNLVARARITACILLNLVAHTVSPCQGAIVRLSPDLVPIYSSHTALYCTIQLLREYSRRLTLKLMGKLQERDYIEHCISSAEAFPESPALALCGCP